MRVRHLLLEGLSFAYWVVRRLFELLILFGRSERAKELEILVLRHELQVLRRPGGPPLVAQMRELILRLAAENPSWGYKRIEAELVSLGMPLSASSIWNVLDRHGIEPAPRRASISWREFLRQQAAAILECDFFTVET